MRRVNDPDRAPLVVLGNPTYETPSLDFLFRHRLCFNCQKTLRVANGLRKAGIGRAGYWRLGVWRGKRRITWFVWWDFRLRWLRHRFLGPRGWRHRHFRLRGRRVFA